MFIFVFVLGWLLCGALSARLTTRYIDDFEVCIWIVAILFGPIALFSSLVCGHMGQSRED